VEFPEQNSWDASMTKEYYLLLSILTEFTNSIATSSTWYPRILGIDQIVISSTFAVFSQENILRWI
jgi:hypothetical protein